MTDDTRLELSGPPTPEMLDGVHDLVERLWDARPGVGAADRMRFEMAVIEILGNIIEHAYEPSATGDDGRRFEVTLVGTDTELVASISDNGLPMSLDLSTVAMPDADAESGRGLALAAATLDDLAYLREDGRNHWRLTCALR